MSFLKSLLSRRPAAPTADDVFAKSLRRIQRSQPPHPRFQALFTRSRSEPLAA